MASSASLRISSRWATAPIPSRCGSITMSTHCAAGWATPTGRWPPTSSTRSRTRSNSSASTSALSPRKRHRGTSTASSAGTSTGCRDRDPGRVLYCNDGDWVESCTALVEQISTGGSNSSTGRSVCSTSRAPRASGTSSGGPAAEWTPFKASPTDAHRSSVSDAWYPQINGVVRTLSTVAEELRLAGHDVHVIGPDDRFRTVPCPTYPDIRLAVDARRSRARAPHRRLCTGRDPHLDRGAAGVRGAPVLPAEAARLHHRLPHQIPGIYRGPQTGIPSRPGPTAS